MTGAAMPVERVPQGFFEKTTDLPASSRRVSATDFFSIFKNWRLLASVERGQTPLAWAGQSVASRQG
jgi:hypothetical protein